MNETSTMVHGGEVRVVRVGNGGEVDWHGVQRDQGKGGHMILAKRATISVPPRGGDLTKVCSVIVVWYVASCWATTSTKRVLHKRLLRKDELLLFQMIGTVIYLELMKLSGLLKFNHSVSTVLILKYEILGSTLAYLFGFLTLQFGLHMVSVSFAITMRGFEPVTSCVFSILVLSETLNRSQWVAILLVCAGVSLCAGADKTWTLEGLLVLVLCDVCFSCRSLCVKLLRRKCTEKSLEKMTGPSIFFITAVGSCLALIVWQVFAYFVFAPTVRRVSRDDLPILLFNGASFTLYNAMSYILLGMVEMSVHAIGNAVRQVVVIMYSVYVFSSPLTTTNVLGILCAMTGVALYSVFTEINIEKPTNATLYMRANSEEEEEDDVLGGGEVELSRV